MTKELRKLRRQGGEGRAKANYIAMLISRGKINAYESAAGYVAYDTDELKNYRKTVRRGRPPKTKMRKEETK